MSFEPDPVSVLFTRHAAVALRAAARREGRWVPMSVPLLKGRDSAALIRAGIDPYGGDGNGHGVNRTVRGFVRALYRRHGKDQTLALVWRGGEPALTGWRIEIMLAAPGSPQLPPAAPAFTEPIGSGTTADPFNRDW
ncbi:MAG TPA: hypothetical protein VGG50_11460 [Streptosporangiaceae bacterium]|jgi:hypothetical protein